MSTGWELSLRKILRMKGNKFLNVSVFHFIRLIYNVVLYIYIYIYISKVKLVTIVKGDPKTPFSITTRPRCRRGRYFIPCIAPFYSWSLLYSAECKARRHQVPLFEYLVWLDLGIKPGFPDYWWCVCVRARVCVCVSVCVFPLSNLQPLQ